MEKLISRKNKHLIHAKKLGSSRSYREQCGEFLCDGKKLLAEAIAGNAEVLSVFTDTKLDITLPEQTKIYEVEKDILSSISPLKNPQEILFICKIPPSPEIDYTRGIHILLDNVQDPGNIGTIIRSAAAFNINSILLTDGCADTYNPKTIRASMGAIFKQKFKYTDIGILRGLKLRIIGTASDNKITQIGDAGLRDCIIVLGNEGQGISKDIISLCSEMITIPISNNCESLNVAAAASIIMYEAGKSLFIFER